MAVLLNSAVTDGFGADVPVTSSFASVRVSGIPTDSASRPCQRVVLYWSEGANADDAEPMADVMQWSRAYPVDLPAGSGTVKAKLLGSKTSEPIDAVITFG